MFKMTRPSELDRAHKRSGRKIQMEVESSNGDQELGWREPVLGWRPGSMDLSLQIASKYKGMNLQEEQNREAHLRI